MWKAVGPKNQGKKKMAQIKVYICVRKAYSKFRPKYKWIICDILFALKKQER